MVDERVVRDIPPVRTKIGAMSEIDFGLFGPGSVTWRIHGDPSSLVGGLRALLIQALNPRAMAAVDQHSDYRTDPWGRLRRTSEYLNATTFGDTTTAHKWAARVRAIHRRVQGIDPVTGRTYRADDPELLLWVHIVEVDSFLTAYRRYAGPVSETDADRYVSEMTRSAELVGLSSEDVPHRYAEVTDYMGSVKGLAVTSAVKEGMRYVLAPPMPLWARPLWAVPTTAAVAILPEDIRELYGLRWWAPAGPIVRASVYALFRAMNIALPPPPPVREAMARVRSAA
jgi:uncharacterized protein (DUF2236 family)